MQNRKQKKIFLNFRVVENPGLYISLGIEMGKEIKGGKMRKKENITFDSTIKSNESIIKTSL